jgi:RimJ/RimL family protein N-acetyltransferase
LKLVPDDFDVPDSLEQHRFRLRKLTVNDVVKDFAAINARVAPDGTPDPWDDTPFLENLAELGWHETEFKLRRSFAYTVVRPDESEVIGCAYFYPPRDDTHDVDVRLWVTRAAWEEGLYALLREAIERWIADAWPFERPRYSE